MLFFKQIVCCLFQPSWVSNLPGCFMSSSWLSLVQAQRAIAVIRAPNVKAGVEMAKAVAAGGMRLLEITWTSEQPTQLIEQLRSTLPECWIGAGTLLTNHHLKAAIAAGAQFLFSPHVNLTGIEIAQQHQLPIIPGALSPSEIVTAWQAGATCVKVFPVQAVGGAAYIRHLREPLAEIPLIPTGGVTIENAPDFLVAGAVAVCLGGQLFPQAAIAQQDWASLTERAATLMQRLNSKQSAS
jgi:2-dehydro-3-deoxyphosphogluconate aldolase/(4S)-4-hydroxy-2-oxoglutarate aldolase